MSGNEGGILLAADGALTVFVITGVRSILYYPTVLHLSGAVVRADNTVNLNKVACNGLSIHRVVTGVAGCVVGAVNGKLVTVCILDVHITVGGLVYLLDSTYYVILVGCICAAEEYAECVCLGNGESRICCGKYDLGAAFLVTSEVAVCINAGVSGNIVGILNAASALAVNVAVSMLVINENCVLKLSVVVLTNNGKNGDGVADLGLMTCELRVLLAVLIVETVYVNAVLAAVDRSYDVHITVDGVSNLLNLTDNVELFLGVLILNEVSNEVVCVLDGDGINALNGYVVFLGLGNAVKSEGRLELNDLGLCGNGEGNHAVVKSSAACRINELPCDLNSREGLTYRGKRDGRVLLDYGGKALLHGLSNLEVVGLFYFNYVGEAISRNGIESELVVVKTDNTGYVSLVVEVVVMY